MKLTDKQEVLLTFVKACHGDQKRKYTGEPYWTHPYEVARLVNEIPYGKEVALCHDLIEDTPCQLEDLLEKLIEIGYSREERKIIVPAVNELTDVFTTEAYPEMNRKIRKAAEAQRLFTTGALAQTVKYADMAHNTASICKYDPGFAKVYLKETKHLVKGMRKGDFDLYLLCCYSLVKGMSVSEAAEE